MKLGIQLFGVLRDGDISFPEALALLKGIGYTMIEPCLAPDMEASPMPQSIWTLETFEQNARLVREAGLDLPSVHLFARDLAACAPVLARLARTYGVRYFVVNSPRELTVEALQETALNYMRTADLLQEAGAELLIHNESADISAKIAGVTACERLMDLCLGRLAAEVDVGWVYHGGVDPLEFLRRNAHRVRAVHFKDLAMVDGQLKEVPAGSGLVDTRACFQFARAVGATQFVDLDRYPTGREPDVTAAFRGVHSLSGIRDGSVSYLNVLDTETGAVKTLKKFDGVIEAPNWLKKEDRILYNADGLMYAYDIASGETVQIDTGACDHCNNDHVVSADERFLAVSHMDFQGGFSSRVYVLPLEGGTPRLVTPKSPSFLHGWSPDGEEMAYCAFREIDGQRQVDVYVIPAAGGEETRLTQGGFNDGPEYSPDGQYIWFNSTRTGLMQVWRMKRDGSEQTQMTFTERNNWFGHVSPDGKKVAYLSYRKDDLEPHEHLPNMQVELWLMNADGSEPHRVAALFGGQGSINVNSWAGDSRRLAFVSYSME